jgi:hypothetical protein
MELLEMVSSDGAVPFSLQEQRSAKDKINRCHELLRCSKAIVSVNDFVEVSIRMNLAIPLITPFGIH